LLGIFVYLFQGVAGLQEEVEKNKELAREERLISEEIDRVTEETEHLLSQIDELEQFTSKALDELESGELDVSELEEDVAGNNESEIVAAGGGGEERDWDQKLLTQERSLEESSEELSTQHRELENRRNYEVLSRARRNVESLQEMLPEKGETIKELKEDAEVHQDRMMATPEGWPTQGRFISGYGNRRDPITYDLSFHSGVDIANSRNTPIYATAYGTVVYANYRGAYGNLVIIDHGYGYETYYAHLNRIEVSKGENVSRGDRIGLMGSTGRSLGDHLHYEVHLDGETQDPKDYMD